MVSTPLHLKISGCYFRDCGLLSAYYSVYAPYAHEDSSKAEFNDNLGEMTSTNIGYLC